LTCPVTEYASRDNLDFEFKSLRFTDFPTMAESFKAGHLKASFFIAPLAMKLVEQGLPAKIVYLGHRDGSTIIVHKNSKAKNLLDLKGQKFAIPSRYSNQYLVVLKLMQELGMQKEDLEFVEIAPPEMPQALERNAIAGYFVGEPHAGKAELAGFGRVLHYAKDIWPRFISCVLVVHDSLIQENPKMIEALVHGIAESGEWAETHRVDAAKLAAPLFRQDAKLIEYVLTHPHDRVSYRGLTPTEVEFEDMIERALKAGILQKKIAVKDLIETRFIPEKIRKIQLQAQ
jgi:NitT/TauT family transport system substrate-binding protein